jgi:uncharacterized protein DUF1353
MKTTIRTPLVLHPLPHRRWLVLTPFVVDTLIGPITVPAGFNTDLNSIPRLWWAVSPVTDYPEAGVVHDYLYAIQCPREMADTVYAELLTLLGMDRLRVAGRYMSLRLFGGRAYRSHQDRSV